MRKWIVIAALLCLALPAAWLAAQPAARLEASAINTDAFPTLTLSLSVLDAAGQPVRGLSASDFTLAGDAAAQTQIVSVEEVTDDNLPLAVVLAIDVSSSMFPSPIERAKAAAQAFVDSLRPQDFVALLTFGTNVSVEQNFTTDRAALSAAIAQLQAGGQTALYQGAFEAVNLAATAPVPRRAVILLGDGAEFGGRSLVARNAALDDITRLGVPVYTIGLGFGADRTYLEALSRTSSARFYESPTPDELAAIYANLSALFRSQYLVTLATTVPGDGTVYTLGIDSSAAGGVSGETSFRAPINTPIVRIIDPPIGTIASDVFFTVEVLADQPLESVIINDQRIGDFVSPYTVNIIPFDLEPGERTYSVRATDADGDSGEASVTVNIAPLAPNVIFSNLTPGEVLTENRTVGIEFVSQTPVVHVAYFLDGQDVAHRVEAPWDFTINVENLTPGEHTLRVIADNAGGSGTFEEITFVVDESIGLTQTASAMPTATATFTPSPTRPTATLTPTPLPQGEGQSPTPTVGTRNGASVTPSPTPPVGTRNDASAVPASATPTPPPPTPDTAATVGAQASQTAVQVALVALAADATATSEAQASATQAEVTAVAQVAASATPTPDLRATANAQATQTAVPQQTAAAQSTQTAVAQNAMATENAQASQTAVAAANADATATANVGATQTIIAQATANVQATQAAIRVTANAQATATQAAIDQQATAQVQTQTAQAVATQAAATAATETAIVRATNAAEATSVQATVQARETRRAVIQVTQTAGVQLTADARATAVSTVVAVPTLTSTPVPTRALLEVDAQSPPATADFLPLICVVGAIAGILAVIFILLGGRRRRERR